MASNETIYSSDYISVEYQPDHERIFHIIHQPIGEEQAEIFKEALLAGSDALKKHGLKKWMSDDRKNGPLVEGVITWAEENWYKPTIDAGWKYWANIVPTDIRAASSLQPVVNHLYSLGLRMMVFSNKEDAEQWLDSQ